MLLSLQKSFVLWTTTYRDIETSEQCTPEIGMKNNYEKIVLFGAQITMGESMTAKT